MNKLLPAGFVKIFFLFCFALVIFTGNEGLSFENKSSLSVPGDVNGNGVINQIDRELLEEHIIARAPLEGAPLERADANQDGKVDVADLVCMQSLFTFPVIEMVSVPAGTFTMGARDDLDDGEYAGDDEYPRHEVTLSAYQIGKYEVTNGQYCEVMNYALSKGYLENSNGSAYSGGDVYYNGNILLDIDDVYCQISYKSGYFTWESRDGYSMENHPVVEVSWYGSVAFCNWLSEIEGKTPAYNLSTCELTNQFGGGYRLPTEAECERAAAWDGKHWIYSYMSDTASSERMNYNSNNPLGLSDYPYTTGVGYYAIRVRRPKVFK